jgi:FlaG/FlaF family flagellin (archaellin)
VVDTGGLVSAPATVNVRVNRPPVAFDVQAALDPGVATAVPLSANDPDGDVLTITVDDVPSDVIVTVAGMVLTVTVTSARAGSQFTFDYTATDPSGLGTSAVVTINVTGTAPTTTTTTPTTTTTTTTKPPPSGPPPKSGP